MDFVSLYYFSELAKDLNMTKTANRLYISQQTLSYHIQRLESYYDTPLFDRKPALRLTSAGEFVLAFAREVGRGAFRNQGKSKNRYSGFCENRETLHVSRIVSDAADQAGGASPAPKRKVRS